MELPGRLKGAELFAWVGEDEHGSGVVGLKQGVVPAGMIPLVATTVSKVDNLRYQMFTQARMCGKKIYLCRYVCVEVVECTEAGVPLK